MRDLLNFGYSNWNAQMIKMYNLRDTRVILTLKVGENVDDVLKWTKSNTRQLTVAKANNYLIYQQDLLPSSVGFS